VAEVPEGQLLEVEFTLSELHRVDTPAPGVTKKVLAEPEGNYMKPNDGSTVTIVVSTRSVDGTTVYEEEKEVTFTTDEEQVRLCAALLHYKHWLALVQSVMTLEVMEKGGCLTELV
jgi:hypothetical protein